MDYDDQDDYDGTLTGSEISKKTPSGNWASRTDCGESNSSPPAKTTEKIPNH